MYKFTPLKTIEAFIPEMERLGVSQVARSKDQFLDQYRKYGSRLPIYWDTKRTNFIKRHLVQYKLNPTYRRKLALLAWAYQV